MAEPSFDVIVIGAGPTGENVADRTVQGGLSTAIVEHELVGGECSYWACMPTKALLRDSAALRAVRALPGANAAVTGALDAAAVLTRRDSFTAQWHDDGQVDWLAGAGITLVRGHGRLAGPRTVEVTGPDGTTTLTARHAVVLATGSSPQLPPIPGLRAAAPWTNREAAAAQHIPDRLAVIGGGVVGAEMATAFQALGAQVTLIVRGRLLPSTEDFAGAAVAEALTEAGVDLRLQTGIDEVRRAEDGVHLTLSDGSQISTDEVLVAAGRRPTVADIGLDTVGLSPQDRVRVDDALRLLDPEGKPVAEGTLYAAGDTNARAPLTHHGKYQARALGDAIAARARGEEPDLSRWGRHAATADVEALTQVIFADPEIAAVGLTAAAAEKRGLRVRVIDADLGRVAGAALHADHYRGQARLVIDDERDVVVGFTVVGADTAEMLQAATIAIVGEVPLNRLWHAVPAYPTMSEVWLRLLEADGRR